MIKAAATRRMASVWVQDRVAKEAVAPLHHRYNLKKLCIRRCYGSATSLLVAAVQVSKRALGTKRTLRASSHRLFSVHTVPQQPTRRACNANLEILYNLSLNLASQDSVVEYLSTFLSSHFDSLAGILSHFSQNWYHRISHKQINLH